MRQAFAATTLSVAGLGSVGYAVRQDLSFLYRLAFWLLLALLAAGLVLLFVHIPAVYLGWTLFGLVVFGLYTVVDFNRLRPPAPRKRSPWPRGSSSTSSTSSCCSCACSRETSVPKDRRARQAPTATAWVGGRTSNGSRRSSPNPTTP